MKGKKKWVIIGVVLLLALVGAFGGDKDEEKQTDQTEVRMEADQTADEGVATEEEAEESDDKVEPEEVTESTEAPDGISPELKEFLDSYEAFFDEYIEFMKTYDDSDAAALLKYASLMEKYYEFSEKAEEWDEKDMTDEESLYYFKVMNRVNEKLYEAGIEMS